MSIKKLVVKYSKKSLIVAALTAFLTQGLISCGSDNRVAPVTAASTGIFLDCEVEGLTYQSGNNPPGVTDENGVFVYTPGEPLSFSVGGVQLGALADGAAICTPFDFVIPENIARFLQSLDGDGDPSNGIDLTTAANSLVGTVVSSARFENPSSTGFETDTAITGAIATAGATLLDTTTTNANLRDGTDTTFDVAELAGFAFAVSDPLDAGKLGVMMFHALANAGDPGSTGSDLPFDETTTQGGTGIAEDFTWTVSAAGILTITFSDGTIATIKRAGGSSRSISGTVTETGSPTRVVTLLKPLPITETSICGAPITSGGTTTRSYTITDPIGSVQVTFKSDGTMTSLETGGAPDPGFWTVGDIASNILKVSDSLGSSPIPNSWALVMFLEGSPATGGQLFESEVMFNGFEMGTNDPILVWDEFFFSAITPN